VCVAVFRFVTLAVATLAAYGGRTGSELAGHGIGAITGPWQQWDANWFTWIARVGYAPLSPVHTNGRVYDAIVWPPLFPGLIAAISGPTGLDQGLVALAISTVVLFTAIIGIFRVVQHDHGEGLALATVVLILVYPSSLFLGAGYTEGLLLGLGAWSFWAAITGRWWLAGILAAAAVMTKFYAVILVAALLWEYLDQRDWSWRRVRADVAWLALPWAVVLAGWLFYVQLLVGDWTRVLTSQKYWDRHLAMPWVSILDAAGTLSRFRFIGVVDLGALVLLVVLTAYSYGRIRRSYTVFLALGVLACVTSSTLVSTGRYTTILFPMFIAAALLLRSRPWLERGVAVTSGVLMLGLLTRFATGHWAG
jgi:hypothetical protein